MARKKLNLKFVFQLRLDDEDKKKLSYLQDTGFNMSKYFRDTIKKMYKDEVKEN